MNKNCSGLIDYSYGTGNNNVVSVNITASLPSPQIPYSLLILSLLTDKNSVTILIGNKTT